MESIRSFRVDSFSTATKFRVTRPQGRKKGGKEKGEERDERKEKRERRKKEKKGRGRDVGEKR